MEKCLPDNLVIRNARLDDVTVIRELINSHAELDRMLFRSLADLYENLRDFKVCEDAGEVIGCCALQIYWADLAEIKSLAVHEERRRYGIGSALVRAAIEDARTLKLPKVFALTLDKRFFEKLGFERVSMDTLPMKVWTDCVRCSKQAQCDEIALVYSLKDPPGDAG